MRQAILERACGQPFVLPAPKECLDVLYLQRAGTHLLEARLTQLTARQRERSQPVCLCGMAAVAVALAEHPQRVRQIIHRNLLSSAQLRAEPGQCYCQLAKRDSPKGQGPGAQ